MDPPIASVKEQVKVVGVTRYRDDPRPALVEIGVDSAERVQAIAIFDSEDTSKYSDDSVSFCTVCQLAREVHFQTSPSIKQRFRRPLHVSRRANSDLLLSLLVADREHRKSG